ncbi:MAG: hypothetical protein OXC82_14660 [Rhodobacteraceae bacterium]|nr:hypothetical protein [Paracoccaceae bacterium]MCY4251661.1 hypothetical protein [Paracoccaceae bacterium]
MNPHDLVVAPLILVSHGPSKPRQVNLKRALSAAYFAMFQALSRNCSDSLVGTAGARRSQRAWQQAYLSIKHRYAKNQCKRDEISGFAESIQEFASKFVELQVKRHQADYNPLYRLTRNDVYNDIETAAMVIEQLQASDPM